MVHSIEFNDVSKKVEKAKLAARKAEEKWDLEYEEYLEKKGELDKRQAEYEAMARGNPEKYPDWNSPRHRSHIREVVRRVGPENWMDYVDCPYQNALDSLNGRTFRFTEGLNVIVGANGSGKTTLLNVIRSVFFCRDRSFSTLKNIQYWTTFLEDDVIPILNCCNIKADFRRCVYCLLKNDEINDANIWGCGTGAFAQKYYGNRMSRGECGVLALSQMFSKIGDAKNSLPIVDPSNKQGMEFQVVSELMKVAGGTSTFGTKAQEVLDYYRQHQVDDARFTVIMDEPDAGFDVFKVKELCGLLERMVDDVPRSFIQPVVVLHNVAIISRLMKKGGVNFIELTPGYLEEVEAISV